MSQPIAILTKNRPEAFRRCVESLRDNASLFGHSIRLVVSDDSTSVNESQNVQTLQNSGLPFVHCNRKFKSQYITRLSSSPILDFALLPDDSIAMGAARNFLTLFLAGQKFIMLDDDMECKFAKVPNASPKIRYSVGNRRTGLQKGWTWRGGELSDDDFITKHQQLWERPKIALTVGGWVGDSGMANTCYLLLNPEFLRNVDSPDSLYWTLKHRQILYSVVHPTIVRWVNCTGMSIGLNAQKELPPFLPVQRGEDVVFGTTLANCTPGLSGYCSYAMHHTPKREANLEDDFESVLPQVLSTFIIQIIVWANPPSIIELGKILKEISSSSRNFHIYSDYFAKARLVGLSKFIDEMDGLPDFVTKETSRLKQAFLSAPEIITPVGMGTEEMQLRLFQYSQLLMAWGTIFDSAKNLAQKEIGVTHGE